MSNFLYKYNRTFVRVFCCYDYIRIFLRAEIFTNATFWFVSFVRLIVMFWYRLRKQMRQLLMLWWWKCEADNVDEYNEEEWVANSKCPPSMNHSSCPNCLFNYTPLSSACGQFFLLFNVINKNCQRHNGPRLLCIGCKFGHWDCPIGVRDFHPQILLTTTMSGWPIDRSRMICHLISNFREGWRSFARWIRTCGGCKAAGREKGDKRTFTKMR